MTRRADRVVVAVAAVALAWATVDLVGLWLLRDGRVMVGIDGPFAGDQLQYLSWVRESGDHVLVRNLYDGSAQDAAFLHPMFLLSGLLWRAGLPLALSFQLWKPVAVGALVLASDRLVREFVPAQGAWRLAALVLGLFAASPLLAVSVATGAEALTGELLSVAPPPAVAGWGYLPTVAALATLAALVVLAARAADAEPGRDRTRWTWGAVAAGFLTSWLHPWEGVVGLLVLAGMAAWARSAPVLKALAGPAVATAAPLLYYAALAAFVPAWSVANDHVAGGRPSVAGLVLGYGPLAGCALLAGRGRGRTIDRAVRLWPVAAVGASLTLGTTAPAHFLASVTLPLGVLAVDGWRHLRDSRGLRRRVGAVAVALFTVPGSVAFAETVLDLHSLDQPHFVTPSERRALAWLEDAPAGSVLASPRLAPAVPALTGQPAWYGHPNWTPAFRRRAAAAHRLFAGGTPPEEAAAIVAGSGARYVLVDCSAGGDVSAAFPGVAAMEFGCARVLVVDGGPGPGNRAGRE